MPSKDSWGGPAACEPPFVEALRGLGVEVLTEDYVFGDKDRPTPFFSRVSRVLKTAFRFRRLLKDHEFDLLFLNSAFDQRSILRDSISLFIIQPRKTKVFLKVHGSQADQFVGGAGAWQILIRYLRRRVDAFGLHTRDELRSFIQLGFSPTQFYRVRNAITIGSEIPDGFVRDQKGSDCTFELLFVARFIRSKGLLSTLRACALLREKGINFALTCVGDGEERKEAETLVESLCLGEVVRFTGYIAEPEVTRLFLLSDIFVFPTSHAEGFPIVQFKAVACGLPIVTTRVRAAGEYLREPDNCLFCTADAEDVAEKTASLIHDRKLREAMSASNFAYGSTLLPEAIAAEYLSMFHAVIDGHPTPHTFDREATT